MNFISLPTSRQTILVLTALAFIALISGKTEAQVLGVGTKTVFPKSAKSGGEITFELWDWPEDKGKRKKVMDLKDGQRIPINALPKESQFQFRIKTDHDQLWYRLRSSEGFDKIEWGPDKPKPSTESPAQRLYRGWPYPFFPEVGRYCLEAKGLKAGGVVGQVIINIEIVDTTPVPVNTQYLVGKKDWKGNPITSSKPVVFGALNETAVLKDNDYAFEPQHAYNVINFERFPPFKLNPRFDVVWNTRRFSDEDKFGGPLNRGFNTTATIKGDRIPINQRTWWYTSNHLVNVINQMKDTTPGEFADLRGWGEHRSAFVTPEHAALAGKNAYNSFGGSGGYAPYDAGIYGWDEEEMWPTIGSKMLKEHPELLPESLKKYKDKPNDPGAKGAVESVYEQMWGDFIGYHYKGAREAAAERGRVLKIWHYGSKAPGNSLFMGGESENKTDPKTGQYVYETLNDLHQWFKKDGKIDFTATEYARQIDYFHKDFYYHVIYPEYATLYEKDKNGYVLDEKGRRKIRKDEFEEKVYVDKIKMGKTEIRATPAYFKSFIAKGENALYFMNGGKYYKQRGSLITEKKMIPAFRPGNQETWYDTVQYGSRPVSPYMSEAAVIYTFMIGLEGLYLWDARSYTGPVGLGPERGDPPKHAETTDTLGEMEFTIKGLHRVSQFNRLFEGNYMFVRPTRHYNTFDSDHPVIRGIINGQYLLLAMTNPYLDPGETQEVEIWYGTPYGDKARAPWGNKVVLQARKTHLFQCKLPKLIVGQGTVYDPDKLYFRYVLKDGKHTETFKVTGNYDVKYPYPN